MKFAKRLILVLIGVIFCIFTLFGIYYFSVTSGVTLQPEKLCFSSKNITVYDKDLTRVDGFNDKLMTAPIESIPKKTQLAFVDTEDKRFFSHGGFDYKRIVKATLSNLKSGGFKEGASTISQQLIKNTHLTHEKTLKRKLKEWKLTRVLEKNYSKQEILEKYLNTIYFGHNCFGIASASNFYFGKRTSELDIADSAILAGLLKSPNNYSPFKNPQKCKTRKETVLSLMYKNGSITKEELKTALEKPLPTPSEKSDGNGAYAHFVFDELTEIAENKQFTLGGNIEIFTYLDQGLQEYLCKLLKDHATSDISASVLDTELHGITACYSTVGNIKRLPGSIIKPLLVYAPAIEQDLISPATPILDEKTEFGGYSPENYDKSYHGYTSARDCLAKSLNIPAVKILQSLGVNTGAEYLKKMNLAIEKEDLTLPLALGGMKNGFSLNELINAYATFPNQGIFEKAEFIKEIKIDGVTIYASEEKNQRVFSEETAYLTTDMLKTTVKSGTAKKLRSLPFDIAGKTGTVGTAKGNTDAYALSYTTKNTVGVWIGNANNSQIPYTGGGLPCNYLYNINEYLYDKHSKNIPTFSIPNGVVEKEIDKTSYYDTHNILLADPNSPADYKITELFKNSAIPTKTSDLFTNPSIIPPILQFLDNQVVITFDKTCPRFYKYKIIRYDYATHTTVYCGEYLERFVDSKVEKNKNYIYTVTPIFNDTLGNTITLPAITTKIGENIIDDNKILDKPWWDY